MSTCMIKFGIIGIEPESDFVVGFTISNWEHIYFHCIENIYRPIAYINITMDNSLLLTFNDTMIVKDLSYDDFSIKVYGDGQYNFTGTAKYTSSSDIKITLTFTSTLYGNDQELIRLEFINPVKHHFYYISLNIYSYKLYLDKILCKINNFLICKNLSEFKTLYFSMWYSQCFWLISFIKE